MPDWNDLYRDSGVAPVASAPLVQTSLARLRLAGVDRALDLGCGGGRHLVALEGGRGSAHGGWTCRRAASPSAR